jgi:hypothetical protein
VQIKVPKRLKICVAMPVASNQTTESDMPDLPTSGAAGCFGITEWCLEAKFSPALFFKLQRKGEGPKVTHVGARTIVIETPREFYARREQKTAAKPTAEAV